MTVGINEGMSSAIGDELSLLAGFRSTRTTAAALVATGVTSGTTNASSVDSGLTITFTAPVPSTGVLAGQRFRVLSDALSNVVQAGVANASASGAGTRIILSAGAFAAGVQPGRRFRATSGAASGRTAYINKRVSNTEIILDAPGLELDFTNQSWEVLFDLTNRSLPIAAVTPGAPGFMTGVVLTGALGGNFTNQSWDIFTPASTVIPAETTLDWEDAGEVFVGNTRYRYDAKNLTSFVSVRASRHLGRDGRIVCPAGAAVIDGSLLVLDDGNGDVVTLAFDLAATAEPDVRHVRVPYDAGMTQNQIRDAVINAIVNVAQMELTAFAETGTGIVGLRHTIPGGLGLLDVVADANATLSGFVVDGPRGLEESLPQLAEITDMSVTYSAADTYRRAFAIETAEGEDLSTLGRNIGVARPAVLDDIRFRRLVQAIAYAPRGTVYALELALDALLGKGNWEIFEDLTLGSVNHPGTVYVRRTRAQELDLEGKTFLEGNEARPATNSTTVSIAYTPRRVIGVRLEDEPGGRLVAPPLLFGPGTLHDVGQDPRGRLVKRGTNGTVTGGGATLADAGSFSDVHAGDLLIVEGGTLAGRVATVFSGGVGSCALVTAASNVVEGAPRLTLGGLNATNLTWRIVRPNTNTRYNKPSTDLSFEYATQAVATTMWTYNSAGGATEVADSLIVASAAPDGAYLQMIDSGAARTQYYRHRMRIRPESESGWFSLHLALAGTLSATPGDEMQAMFVLRDGARDLAVGVRFDGATGALVGPITTDPGAVGSRFLGATAALSVTPKEFAVFTIRKRGQNAVEFLKNGAVYATIPYASFFANAVDVAIDFGQFSATLAAGELHVKSADWAARTSTDYWNVRSATGSTAAANPQRLTDAAALFVATDDDAPNKKRVRVTSVTAVNAGKGTALGEWEIDTFNAATNVELNGIKQFGGTCQLIFPKRVFVTAEPEIFTFPDILGHKFVIDSGPNAGTYDIAKAIDPEHATTSPVPTNYDLAVRFPLMFANQPLKLPKVKTFVLELATALPDPDSTESFAWHIQPVLPNDATVAYEIVDASSNVGATLTLRQAMPATIAAGDILAVDYTTIPSAMLEDSAVRTKIDFGSAATSVDGISVTLEPGALTGSTVHVGETFRVVNPPVALGLTASEARIATIGPGDALTLVSPGLGGAFTALGWEVLLGPANVEYADDAFLLWPAYLFDDFGYVRDVMDLLTAAGVFADVDHLLRDAAYATGVSGLHISDD